MENYKKYVNEVRQKWTACDIARAASVLHDRADELLNLDDIDRTLNDLGHADVMFTWSDYVVDDVNETETTAPRYCPCMLNKLIISAKYWWIYCFLFCVCVCVCVCVCDSYCCLWCLYTALSYGQTGLVSLGGQPV